jgi:hypothetical protein
MYSKNTNLTLEKIKKIYIVSASQTTYSLNIKITIYYINFDELQICHLGHETLIILKKANNFFFKTQYSINPIMKDKIKNKIQQKK